MRRPFIVLAAVLVPLAVGPGWTGEERLALLGDKPDLQAIPVMLDPDDPARRKAGALTFMGGVELTSADPAFGGYSALTVVGDRVTLLSDGGNIVRFRLGPDWRISVPDFANLPAGPRTGWTKRDRDSESMTRDPATGRVWIGFEGFPQIWRFSPGLARGELGVSPAAMEEWPSNGGAEAFTRLRDGRFVAISESRPDGWKRGRRVGLVWKGDPTVRRRPAFRFSYLPSAGYDPADMTELPDGRLLVLERAFGLPFNWSNRIMLVKREALTPGAIIRGRLVAQLAAPLVHDNFEGIAATREKGRTMLWLVSDDNELFLQRTLLLKFRMTG